MGYDQNNPRSYQRRRHRWITFLFPLAFLLIFAFTRSLAGLFASLAIMVLLWVLIAVASSSPRTRYQPPMQPPPIQQPSEPVYMQGEETPYEQGYFGARSTADQAYQPQAALPSQPYPYPPMPQRPGSSEESNRLAKLKLLGDLYHAGMLTNDEFESQKQRILQADISS